MFEINQYVIIKNDQNHVVYKIKNIYDHKVELIGLYTRTKINVDISELEEAPNELIDNLKKRNDQFKKAFKKIKKRNKSYLFGRILHIDTDEDYLNDCLSLYNIVGIKAEGIYINEKEIVKKIEPILLQLTPDIVVITGHDSFDEKDKYNISSYENSKIFGDAIRIVRKHFNNVVIIAGACKSFYEYLMGQGANFASSPGRINTHTYDPAVVAIKIASTSVNQTADFKDIIKYIEGGKDAIGGVETKGTMRILY